MIGASALQDAVARARAAMADLEQELNSADAKLGDGDTGGMLSCVIERLASVEAGEGDDLGKTFSAYAQAATAATGSSLGTLFATALLVFGKATKGKTTLPPSEFGPILGEARDAMLRRGQSQLGDKTVVDAIHAVSKATIGKSDWADIAAAAHASASATLVSFRHQPCRIGRARMFGDKSRGLDDPGMLAFVRLLPAISSKSSGE
ncbi:dihydroxyacetone kinase subunit L (plasmid) [Mesorhizobium sp. B2-1-8]|uniref:dihydroxyacetone kinase subunit L n=1 Tax=Mesorhizobium sp. B2-1-8 TaxID=2589967 RepID=UPI0011268ACD|nr:dihydroxyacetone kinase subunit L [Mesorhizobium sp. B2-1-8]UCI22812.1 dihydroxyacetone kinase subunit L [Mesorhizobium sp. B2-1-8]